MREFIDKEKARKLLYETEMNYLDVMPTDDVGKALLRAYAKVVRVCRKKIDEMPAEEVRRVVFCKDCTFYGQDIEIAEQMKMEPDMYCALHRAEFGPEAYCSYGRKTPWIE